MKVRNRLMVLGLLLGSVYARATSVTATITDPSSQTWNNCRWSVKLINPSPSIIPSVNGVALTPQQLSQTGVCNGSGVLSVTLVDNTTINIFGTTWQFTVNPNASAPGATGTSTVSGASQSLSMFLSGIVTTPSFPPGPYAYGYADSEVTGSFLLPGVTYYNVSTPAFRQWSGTAWATIGSGGGGSSAWADITSGTNTGQGLVVGTNSVFTTAGNGVNNANELLGVLLSGLGTGIYKFTAGVPSVAVAGDFPTLNQNTTGTAAAATLAANSTLFGGIATSGFCQTGGAGCPTTSGTVTHTVGPLTNLAAMFGNGANDSKIDSAITTDGSGNETAVSYTTSISGGAGGKYSSPEGTTATGSSGVDICYADSTSHTYKCSFNNGSFFNMPQTIASGTSAMATGAITSATCATVVTTTATGTASTDAIEWNPNGSIKAVTGYVPLTTGGLTIAAYPTANAVNFDVCNWTSSSITPGAVTLNWRVVR